MVVFARSREGVRSILAAVDADGGLRAYFRPLRLVGKGGGGRHMSLRQQARAARPSASGVVEAFIQRKYP